MPKEWPFIQTVRTVGSGKDAAEVQVRIRHLLMNPDDHDVDYAFSPFGCSSAGPDADAVIARGQEKAQFIPASLDPGPALRRMEMSFVAVAPFVTRPIKVDLGGRYPDQVSADACGTIKGRGWVAVFTPQTDGTIQASLTYKDIVVEKTLRSVKGRKLDLRKWAKSALVQARRAQSLLRELSHLGIQSSGEEND